MITKSCVPIYLQTSLLCYWWRRWMTNWLHTDNVWVTSVITCELPGRFMYSLPLKFDVRATFLRFMLHSVTNSKLTAKVKQCVSFLFSSIIKIEIFDFQSTNVWMNGSIALHGLGILTGNLSKHSSKSLLISWILNQRVQNRVVIAETWLLHYFLLPHHQVNTCAVYWHSTSHMDMENLT